MKCLLLLASMFTGITGITMPHPGSLNLLLPRDAGPGSQFWSRAAQNFPDEEVPDDSLWFDNGDVTDSASDPFLFAENSDIASSPMVFDEASAAACDNTQSSLDPITDLSGLNARDLIDQFTGLQDLVIPLQQLPDSECSAFTGTGGSNPNEQKPKPGTDNGEPKPGTESLPETSTEPVPRLGRPSGLCPIDYHYALCCSGDVVGTNVMACVYFMAVSTCPVDNQYCCRDYDFVDAMGINCLGMDWSIRDGTPSERSHGRASWFGHPDFLGD